MHGLLTTFPGQVKIFSVVYQLSGNYKLFLEAQAAHLFLAAPMGELPIFPPGNLSTQNCTMRRSKTRLVVYIENILTSKDRLFKPILSAVCPLHQVCSTQQLAKFWSGIYLSTRVMRA